MADNSPLNTTPSNASFEEEIQFFKAYRDTFPSDTQQWQMYHVIVKVYEGIQQRYYLIKKDIKLNP